MIDHDNFMYELRQAPRPAFARDLKTRLNGQPVNTGYRRVATTLRVAVAACIAFALLMIVSPEARAQVIDFVGDVIVTNFGAVQIRATSHLIVSGTNDTSLPLVRMSVEEAQALMPFELPSWVPNGYVREDSVTVIRYSAQEIGIGQKWTRDNSADIILSLMNSAHPQLVTGSNSNARDIQLTRSKAVLYAGSWDPKTGEYGGTSLNLVWIDRGLSYILSSDRALQSDLIHMANSLS